ncbi:MAG: EF-P lysine aminoacylase GenX [Planctomycetes bacterium]|nr:EF-P lysine aminoacylase GenX [Planctomycetota bacterium]
MSTTPGDFLPTASWSVLQQRAALLRCVRAFFETHGFVEVETPYLSADTVVDRGIEPIRVELDVQGSTRTYWLQTSPEFAMKRLLAAGAEAIYQIARVFRAGERGTRHNPEFTMVEWYRRGDDMDAGMERLSELARHTLDTRPATRVTYRAAFHEHLDIDPFTTTVDELHRLAHERAYDVPYGFDEASLDDWLDWLRSSFIDPTLGHGTPCILHDFPATQSALARIRAGAPPVAERFELFVNGIELANGYHELLDASELRRRNVHANEERLRAGLRPLPVESRLLDAMEHGLPACSGVALGFDRLVMLKTGCTRIEDVWAFPVERA